jgi:hypothetical protein
VEGRELEGSRLHLPPHLPADQAQSTYPSTFNRPTMPFSSSDTYARSTLAPPFPGAPSWARRSPRWSRTIDSSSDNISDWLSGHYKDFLALTSSFRPGQQFISEAFFCSLLSQSLGQNFEYLHFRLCNELPDVDNWTYDVISRHIINEDERLRTIGGGGVALYASSRLGGGEAGKGDRKGGKSGKKMEFVEGADGKRLAKGDLWCEFHKVRCTHSTDSCTDQTLANANKAREKERAAKRFEKAEVFRNSVRQG